MSSRESLFLVGLVMMIFYIVKTYILKVGLNPKEKILLEYTPKKIFLLVNIGFVFSLLNMFYVIFMNPGTEYQDWSYFCMVSFLFLWYATCVLGRRRYLKTTKQDMKEFYFHIAVLISYASFFGFLYFT
ncbi:hypothetical protein [Megasphaera sp. DISK 18]|uniref:hypothetical protein n=1 Tax=Megasphaera sp. DISK 18 TaxID=1776081 RepID=UPI00080717D9|nr:hypothetical protein [Megasphaera sp. DISK 18]OBZ32483.1 hypothetical protein A0U42_10270 [Megasphaera sp. DISK 18]